MRGRRWMVVLLLVLMGALGLAGAPLRGASAQVEPPVGVRLDLTRTSGVIGAPMTWRVSIAPPAEGQLRLLSVRSGDGQAWTLLDGIVPTDALTGTAALNVRAVPLQAGELRPAVEVDYELDGDPRTALQFGSESVRVATVEERVAADVVAEQGSVRKREDLSVRVDLHNRSPFTLTEVRLSGIGADLEWADAPHPFSLPPGDSYRERLVATVTDEQPVPRLELTYRWVDALGQEHTATRLIEGERVTFVQGWFRRIPGEIISAFVGVVAGALVTLIPSIVNDFRQRKRQYCIDRNHTLGLLRLMVLQAHHATESGGEIDLEPLETVFTKERLYSVAVKEGVDEVARRLWRKAQDYNRSLNRPGGADRSRELGDAAEALKEALDGLREGEAGS